MLHRKPLLDDMADHRRDVFGRWILLALIVSLFLHGLGWNLSKKVPVESMSDSFYERIVPRSFQVERVDIDPRLLEKEPEKPAPAPVPAKSLQVPEERISPLDSPAGDSLPKLPDLDSVLLEEKPLIPDAVDIPDASKVLERADEALREELLSSVADAFPTTPELSVSSGAGADLASGDGTMLRGAPRFSDLDELLQQTGPQVAESAPILLPGDVLFEYDNYELQPRALESLEKLGQLLIRNPGARFVIEGHSDSFGPADYNQRLSELRAESVRNWLIDRMGIDGERIQTRGLGQSRFLVAPTESVEGQMLNRRVEIVIKNNLP